MDALITAGPVAAIVFRRVIGPEIFRNVNISPVASALITCPLYNGDPRLIHNLSLVSEQYL